MPLAKASFLQEKQQNNYFDILREMQQQIIRKPNEQQAQKQLKLSKETSLFAEYKVETAVDSLSSPVEPLATMTLSAKKPSSSATTGKRTKARRFAKEPVTKTSEDVRNTLTNKISQRIQSRGGFLPYDTTGMVKGQLAQHMGKYGPMSPALLSPSFFGTFQQSTPQTTTGADSFESGFDSSSMFPLSPMSMFNPNKFTLQQPAGQFGMFPLSPNYAMQMFQQQRNLQIPNSMTSPLNDFMSLNVPNFSAGVYSGPSTAVSSAYTGLSGSSHQNSYASSPAKSGVNTRSVSRKASSTQPSESTSPVAAPPNEEQKLRSPEMKTVDSKNVMLESVNLFTPSTDWSFASALWPGSPSRTAAVPETPTRSTNFRF